MSTIQNLIGLAVFILAGGGLRLYLEQRSKPLLPVENRFEIAVLAGLAHRLAQSGMEVRAAASAVAATAANPASGLITEQDYQRLTYLIADGVYHLQNQ
jgi:predicted nucleic acid-binding protein